MSHTALHPGITAAHVSHQHFRLSDSPTGLSAIRTVGVNLAIWERPPKRECSQAINSLLAARYAVRIDLNPAEKAGLFSSLASVAGRNSDGASVRALAEDIWSLVTLFCEVADTVQARVRLDRVEDDGCLLFHADSLRLRLLCTYAGPGTEWVTNDNANREQLGLRGRSVEAANRAIVIDNTLIRRVAPWHVAVFSGRLREDTPPLIHRSAPVHDKSEHRIRLCVDLPEACGCGLNSHQNQNQNRANKL